MWIHQYFDPTAFFADILNEGTTEDSFDNWNGEWRQSRAELYRKVVDHPGNLMYLEHQIRKDLYDRFRLAINPFTYRKFSTYLPDMDWPARKWIPDAQLARISHDPCEEAYVDCGRNALAAVYPSRLALFVHFKSCLRYHCTWDLRAVNQEQPDPPKWIDSGWTATQKKVGHRESRRTRGAVGEIGQGREGADQ